MAEMEIHHDGEHGDDHHDHEMTHDDRLSMLKMHHKQTLWVYWTLPLLGLWLLVAPFHFRLLERGVVG